jgi:nucleotide-binding universal stress UspA family protein
MKAVRNILVGTDFSPASRAAFRRAVELAAANEAALWIAYVGLPTVRLSPIGQEGPARDADLSAALGVDARTQLQLLVTRARQAGVRARTVPLVGVPHLALNLAARRHRADLIVIGTHGRKRLARIPCASVAARVVGTAPCAVLTVPAR